MRLVLFTILFVSSLATSFAQTASKHPFTAADWSTLHSAEPQAISADGQTILYVVNHGAAKGPAQHEWWTIRPDGTHAQKLDLPADFHPEGFTRDALALYGAFKINNQMQFAVFALNGLSATATPQTAVFLPNGMEAAKASPNGARYAILANPRAHDPEEGVHTVVEPNETSLYVVNADGTQGQWWCPDLKMISGSPASLAWAGNSNSLAVLSSTPNLGYHAIHSFIDVCSASGARRVTEVPDSAQTIGWIDGGREIAFIGTTNHVLTPEHVWTVPAAGGVAVDRTPDLDATAIALKEDPHRRVWVQVNRGVRTEIDVFGDNMLTRKCEWADGFVNTLPVLSEYQGSTEQTVFAVEDPAHSANLAVPGPSGLQRITHEGDEEIAKLDLGTVQTVHWTSKEGIALEGIVTFPPGYTKGKQYPFLVLPHGGPEASDLLGLDPFSQIVAGMGYVVLQPEYRGSTGYGATFLEAIYQHFGDRAFRDVDSATDYAIAQGWANPKRLAIFGWSAGGFMTSWTVTQTNRYRAAVEGAGITDWASFIWTSDIQQFDYDDRWTDADPEPFRKFSAVDFADKVTTPLLILHGANDHRVPTFQGLEFYAILAARGKTARMVEYPGSPHFPTLWEQRIDVFREISDWLKKYNP
ncbi:MAG TPA: S9 family peptidase [Bryobacteraceae bacterium]|jgi:dipeptidyl aminopeptidase/acylaminoacyl peptidase|nr:S9 family peptidase [Bryobacteraceae bacterium]